MEDLKKEILQQVYNNFVNSFGYNGCSVYDLGYDCTKDELLQCLIELIKEGKIEIITGDVSNTYIKSFDAESIEHYFLRFRLLITVFIQLKAFLKTNVTCQILTTDHSQKC